MLRRITPVLNALNVTVAVYCTIAAAVLLWPLSAYVLVFVALAAINRKRRHRLTTLGSARWADEHDLRAAGMLGASSGLILGRLPRAPTVIERISGRSRADDLLVRLPNAVHTAIYAPTGLGKGVSFVLPSLMSNPGTTVVLDFKGELARQTADYRRKVFGHQIALIDPDKTVTQMPDTYNPVDSVDEDHPLAIDDCNDIANALVARTGRETESHWNDSAESLIAAVLATVVGYGERGSTRSLHAVREIISQPKSLETAIKLMCESDKWGGALRSMGGQLLHFESKEKASVISSALRHLRFLGTPPIFESTRSSSFDPSLLRQGKMTVYLILPPDRAHAQTGLLRLWVASLLRSCVRGGLQ